ncbi:MAG: SirB2 family protein [Betaproteobacteria bacterium]|nr:SirB2 family protein [Betaproteobacteria bacterium]
MLDYGTLKLAHVACVIGSYALFLTRGIWMLQESPRLQQRWVRVVPHVVDTFLLASAIAMVVMSGQYPFVAGWLTAKVVALIAYIGLGMLALRRARTRGSRLAAWVGAQAVFIYIVAVALTRQALPFVA